MIIVDGITQDDLETWKGSVVTRQVLRAVQKALDEKRGDLGRGMGFNKENAAKTQATAWEGTGYCAALVGVLEVEAG